jgi:ADP-ribose pyrophosphatase YjhB (NUDIX family)
MKLSRRKALFDTQNVPPGGVCLSSFVIVRNPRGILVGKMVKPEIWIERFFVGERFAPTYVSSNKYLLPARHLAWYESPLEAAADILRDQVGLRVPRSHIHLLDVQSHIRGDVKSVREPPHWDICFVYETRVPASTSNTIKSPPWFGDLHFVSLSSLSQDDFTRGHGDVLQEARLIRKTKRV